MAIVLSVDLRDAMGDRLYLSDGFRRDGVSYYPLHCVRANYLSADTIRYRTSTDITVSITQLLSHVVLADLSARQHTQSLDAQKAVAQSRKSRGFFDVILRRSRDTFRPTYNYKPDGGACRVYGSMTTKKVTGRFEILRGKESTNRYFSKLTHHNCWARL